MYSQLGGTFPAPLFLFLAGISFALVTVKLLRKGLTANQIARSTIRRGAEILGLGLLFRLQEFLIGWGWAPKSDLLRVDVLNDIGLSMILMGLLCWAVLAICGAGDTAKKELNLQLIAAACTTSLLIALLSPLLWTTWRPDWLPWPIESYINGVHNLGTPQAWLFPIFPWSGFAFAGLAVGFILQGEWTQARETQVFLSIGIGGVMLIGLSRWLDRLSFQLYPVYDYWHTSPEFFIMRLGMLLVILATCYAWCHCGAAQWGFSPFIPLGQASLVVYWVHIEFVYGRVSILPKHSEGIFGATVGLVIIAVTMLGLAYLGTHLKDWTRTPRAQVQLKTSA